MHKLISPHGDYDHCGDAENVINKFKVKNVIFNNDGFKPLEKNIINITFVINVKIAKKSIQKIMQKNIIILNTENKNDKNIYKIIES